MNLTFEQLLQIVETSTTVHILLTLDGGKSETPNGNTDDSIQIPNTLLIRMIEREAFKKPSGYNDAGKPIMEKIITGFRAEVGDIFQVYVEQIIADGGARYWRIWRGENGDTSMRDWHVSVSRSMKL